MIVARADQLRATLRDSLATPCICGTCPSDEDLRAALTLDDEALVALLDGPTS